MWPVASIWTGQSLGHCDEIESAWPGRDPAVFSYSYSYLYYSARSTPMDSLQTSETKTKPLHWLSTL